MQFNYKVKSRMLSISVHREFKCIFATVSQLTVSFEYWRPQWPLNETPQGEIESFCVCY